MGRLFEIHMIENSQRQRRPPAAEYQLAQSAPPLSHLSANAVMSNAADAAEIYPIGDYRRVTKVSPLPPFDPNDLARDRADAHWVYSDSTGKAIARCSLWWQNTPNHVHFRVGLIGHYAATDMNSGHRILAHACRELAKQGMTLAAGPMDGSTWRHHRLVVERGTEPRFFMEPDNPDDWPLHFKACGFAPVAHCRSSLQTDLTIHDPRMNSVVDRTRSLGIRVRELDPRHFEDELHRIYTISIASFRNNFLFMPLNEADFMQQYRSLLRYLCPQLVLIAERGRQPIGFLFLIPDHLQAQRGEPVNTIIVKTIAVIPGRAYAGLGNLLCVKAQGIVRELGYTRAIHALMHESNSSLNSSARYAQGMRRYALFARPIGKPVSNSESRAGMSLPHAL